MHRLKGWHICFLIVFSLFCTAAMADPVDSGSCGETVFWSLSEEGELSITGSGPMEDYESWNMIPWYSHQADIRSLNIAPTVTRLGNSCFAGLSISSVSIPDSVTSIGEGCFEQCGIKSLTIPATVRSLGRECFANCSALQTVSILSSMNTLPKYCFSGCHSLSVVNIQGAIRELDPYCFHMSGVKRIYLPASLASIGDRCFLYCDRLSDVIFAGTQEQAEAISIYYAGGSNANLREAVWYYASDMQGSRSGSCGADVSWMLENGTLTISGSGVMDDYLPKKAPWYAYREGIASVVVVSGVTRLGAYCFADCYHLGEVSLSSTVTTLGDCCFQNCEVMTEIDMPSSVTDIGSWAFDGCKLLTHAVLPSRIASLPSGCFHDCVSLETIEIPELVTELGYSCFRGCSSLASVALPSNINILSQYAFYGCSSLEAIEIPDSVSEIGESCFQGCKALSSVTFPLSIFVGNNCFSDCDLFTDVYYSGSSVQAKEIITPSNALTGRVWHCTDMVFVPNHYGVCGNDLTWTLENGVLTISGEGPMDDFKSGDAPWYNVRASITSVSIDPGVSSLGNYCLYNCPSLSAVSIPDSVTRLGNGCFSYCISLPCIEIPNSVTALGDSCFSGCSSLNGLQIPEGVRSLSSRCFCDCSAFTSIVIPRSVSTINAECFRGCSALSSVSFEGCVASIGTSCFENCSSLADIICAATRMEAGKTNISTYGNDNIINATWHYTDGTYEGWSRFRGEGTCGEQLNWLLMDNILIISGEGEMQNYVSTVSSSGEYTDAPWYELRSSIRVVVIEPGVSSLGRLCFAKCNKITEVILPDSVASLGDYCFEDCSNLTSISIPYGVTAIGTYAFQNCAALSHVLLPNSVERLNSGCFEGCTSLNSIEVPDSVTNVGYRAFSDCNSLTNIEFRGSAPVIKNNSFSNVTATVSYPAYDLSWTKEKLQNYGGSLTWVGFGLAANAKDYTYSICDGEAIITGLAESCMDARAAVIPDTIEGTPITAIGDGAFRGCTSLTSITIPSSVTSIGSFAFYNCTGLTNIAFPENVSFGPLQTFYGCTGLLNEDGLAIYKDILILADQTLETVTIPENVTSICHSAFWGCTELTSIIIPDSVVSIGNNAFYECSSLTDILIPNGVVSIGDAAFGYCSSLAEITIPERISVIEAYTFSYCSSLSRVTFPCSITEIRMKAFAGCSGLTSIVFNGSAPVFGGNGFLDVTAAAYYPVCNSTWTEEARQNYGGTLTWVGHHNISEYVAAAEPTCTEDGYAEHWLCADCGGCFSDEEGTIVITDVVIPALGHCWTEDWMQDDSEHWHGCEACGERKDAEIHGYDNVNDRFCNTCDYNRARGACGEHVTWLLDREGNLTISGTGEMCSYSSASFYGWYNYRSEICSVTIGSGVTAIGSYAFSDCSGLTELTIEDGVETLGDSCFANCTRLEEVTVPGSVARLGAVFGNCSSLNTVILSEGICYVDDAFSGCDQIKTIYIPSTLTSAYCSAFQFSGLESVYITDLEAFCSIAWNGSNSNGNLISQAPYDLYLNGELLTDLTLPVSCIDKTGGNYSVTSCFRNCASLRSLTVPEGYSQLRDRMFKGCVNLATVSLPEGILSLPYSIFQDCTSLTSITLPEGLTDIGSSAFEGCTSLASITLPESVTSIAWSVFQDCTSLTGIVIPDGVTTIDSSTFSNCTSLAAITIPESVTSISEFAFYNCGALKSVTIPEGVLRIGRAAFERCGSLSSVVIPVNVTEIGLRAFAVCSGLTEIAIPASVTDIGSDAFIACKHLEKITFFGNAPTIGNMAFNGVHAVAYYPVHDGTWTEEVRQDYDGALTWVGYHNISDHVAAEEPTCTEDGHAEHWLCADCGGCFGDEMGTAELMDVVLPAIGHSFAYTTPPKPADGEDGETGAVTCVHCGEIFRASEVIRADAVLKLPRAMKTVGEEAFLGMKAQQLTIPEGVTEIKSRAFAGCLQLRVVVVPDSLASFAEDAFDSCGDIVFLCSAENTVFRTWAQARELTVVDINS